MNVAKPLRKPGLVAQETGEETLLYSTEGRAVHVLNPTARFIWERCDGAHTVADIGQAVRTSFAVAPEHDVEEDVQRTLSVFAEKELLSQMD